MIKKLSLALAGLVILLAAGGFAVLGFMNIQVKQTQIAKIIPNEQFFKAR